MSEYHIRRAPLIHAEIKVPGDKSISHRAVILSSLSNGTCLLKGFLPSEDCLRTVDAMRALGINIEQADQTTLVVHGRKGVFDPPPDEIDCGNSGTTMRLLSGLLAAQPFTSRLSGDESLNSRPMGRIIAPLTQMGAKVSGRNAERAGKKIVAAPLEIQGGPLTGIRYESPVASAQVKSAVLLAGLFAKGKTTVIEPSQSRDHTERLLKHFLVSVAINEKLHEVSVFGNAKLESRPFLIPGDISSAAFWLVAGAAQPGSHLVISDVGLNKTRTGVLSVLSRMGASLREVIEEVDQTEPIGKIEVRGTSLTGTVIRNTPPIEELRREGMFSAIEQHAPEEAKQELMDGELTHSSLRKFRVLLAQESGLDPMKREEILNEVARLEDCVGVGIANVIDELPVLAVAGALAQGTTIIRDAAELRVKESDRIEAIVENLRAMGARVETRPEGDGLVIHGGVPLRGARLKSFGDHRIAMAFAIAGLFADGETIIDGTECVATSYPGFEETLSEIMKPRSTRIYQTPVIADVNKLELGAGRAGDDGE